MFRKILAVASFGLLALLLRPAAGHAHPRVATTLNNLAGVYLIQGRYAEAEPLSKRSLDILERKLGNEHPNVATALSDLANLYFAQRKWNTATG